MPYLKNSTHIFVAIGVMEGNDDRKYLKLCRAGHDQSMPTDFVPAFDFQTEWVDKFPCQVWCEVLGYREDTDKYILQQCYFDALKELYSGLPAINFFKVTDSKIDSKTNNNFYVLKDAYGLNHRLYTKPSDVYCVGEEVEMLVKSIVERGNRHAYLELAMPTKNGMEDSKDAAVSEDPRKESRFGQENETKEFKSSIVFTPADVSPRIDEQIKTIMKTIAGFMNKDGGTLYLGVNDAGNVCGIESDYQYLNTSETDKNTYKPTQDHYELKIRESIKRHLTNASLGNLICMTFEKEDDKTYCVMNIKQSKYPVFFNGTKLFQRMGNQTNLLRDFEIYMFVVDRMNKFNLTQLPTDTEDVTESEFYAPDITETAMTIEQAEEEKVVKAAVKQTINRPSLTPWRYVRLYEDGGWSFGRQPTTDRVGLVREIILPKEKKDKRNNRLMIFYKNGCVASVLIGNVIPRREEFRYGNGWKNEVEILDAFVANDHDLIAYRSQTADGEQWNKLHYSGDVSDQQNMGGKGNKVVNDLLNATITKVALVPTDYISRLDSYRVKSNQTSSSLGYKRSDPSFRDSLGLLDAIYE